MTRLCYLFVFAALAVFAQKAPDLPAPFATPDVRNGAKVIPRPDSAKLTLPAGFVAEEYTGGLQKPRFMVHGPSGEVPLTESIAKGTVTILTDSGKSQKKLLEG